MSANELAPGWGEQAPSHSACPSLPRPTRADERDSAFESLKRCGLDGEVREQNPT
jgi:hypothetical protein